LADRVWHRPLIDQDDTVGLASSELGTEGSTYKPSRTIYEHRGHIRIPPPTWPQRKRNPDKTWLPLTHTPAAGNASGAHPVGDPACPTNRAESICDVLTWRQRSDRSPSVMAPSRLEDGSEDPGIFPERHASQGLLELRGPMRWQCDRTRPSPR
jgi:hypothetical protein